MKSEEIIIRTEDVLVRVIELLPDEHGPIHCHTEITDEMFGISGEITVELTDPATSLTLVAGTRCTIKPGKYHRVINNRSQPSKYLLIQGVGRYDFIRQKA